MAVAAGEVDAESVSRSMMAVVQVLLQPAHQVAGEPYVAKAALVEERLHAGSAPNEVSGGLRILL